MSKMELLSKDLFLELASKLNGASLIRLCQTNKNFNQLCDDQYFWKYKLKQDYPMQLSETSEANDARNAIKANEANEANEYKQIYLTLFKIGARQIPIYYNDQYLIDLWITDHDTYQTVFHKLQQSPMTSDILQGRYTQVYQSYNDSEATEVVLTFKHNNITLFKSNVYGIEKTHLSPKRGEITSVQINDNEIFGIHKVNSIDVL